MRSANVCVIFHWMTKCNLLIDKCFQALCIIIFSILKTVHNSIINHHWYFAYQKRICCFFNLRFINISAKLNINSITLSFKKLDFTQSLFGFFLCCVSVFFAKVPFSVFTCNVKPTFLFNYLICFHKKNLLNIIRN